MISSLKLTFCVFGSRLSQFQESQTTDRMKIYNRAAPTLLQVNKNFCWNIKSSGVETQVSEHPLDQKTVLMLRGSVFVAF